MLQTLPWSSARTSTIFVIICPSPNWRYNLLNFRANWRYSPNVDFSWDPAKRLSNIVKHGVDFITAYGMDWNAAVVRADIRQGGREVRLRVILPFGDRLYLAVFTIRTNACRIISMRKASNKEANYYETQV